MKESAKINSYTSAREKNLFRTDSKLWFSFFVSIILMVIVFEISFVIYKSRIDYKTTDYSAQIKTLKAEIAVFEENIQLIKSQEELNKKIISKNVSVSASIEKLLALIPDSIYLDDAFIDKEAVVLKGHTPSKQIFDFFLLPVLKSVFKSVEVSFFPSQNGWLNFQAKCFSEKDGLYEE